MRSKKEMTQVCLACTTSIVKSQELFLQRAFQRAHLGKESKESGMWCIQYFFWPPLNIEFRQSTTSGFSPEVNETYAYRVWSEVQAVFVLKDSLLSFFLVLVLCIDALWNGYALCMKCLMNGYFIGYWGLRLSKLLSRGEPTELNWQSVSPVLWNAKSVLIG